MTDLRQFKSQRDIQAGLIMNLTKKHFSEITVNDICTQALVGRSTFYHHYVDKYALLDEMVTQRATIFDQLLDKRVTDITRDEPLLALYQQLKSDAQAIVCLLQVHEKDSNLSDCYLDSLAHHAQALLPQMTLAIPKEFAIELYSTTALTAISWSLRHGQPEVISHFMNQLFNLVLSTEA
ncbi:TetR/AcrR family transcriptional regulator [Companilactobacillus keshanensis]|uniref:TetR/AcrR family transcriptional regulator n=1 Tax=Companilactobacillus keshanensis TaxID=2486003 RepID=A0ABW4BXX2_9LACO|nr:TetR/AcrR family transcriptional regulator [Companilactobacillus keshanensis]